MVSGAVLDNTIGLPRKRDLLEAEVVVRGSAIYLIIAFKRLCLRTCLGSAGVQGKKEEM